MNKVFLIGRLTRDPELRYTGNNTPVATFSLAVNRPFSNQAGEREADYKDPETLKRYTNEKGKIVPRRVTGNCALHQRYIAKQIKRARAIALMPYTR